MLSPVPCVLHPELIDRREVINVFCEDQSGSTKDWWKVTVKFRNTNATSLWARTKQDSETILKWFQEGNLLP